MDAATGLSAVVTAEMLSGVLDEVVALLPVAIPVMIGFIALRKGIFALGEVALGIGAEHIYIHTYAVQILIILSTGICI